MKLRKFYAALAAVLMGGCMLTACSEDDEPSVKQETTETELIVSGVWKSGEVVHLDRHLVIPEGQSLTIEPGEPEGGRAGRAKAERKVCEKQRDEKEKGK